MLSGGKLCVSQSTFIQGMCEVTTSNGRDLDSEFKDWLVHATGDPTPPRFSIKGFQAGPLPSGEKTLFGIEHKHAAPLAPVLSAFQSKKDDLDVVIVCADRTYASYVLVIKR